MTIEFEKCSFIFPMRLTAISAKTMPKIIIGTGNII